MSLAVAGADPEHREILLRDKPPAFLSVAPRATVPVLVLSNGTVLDESLDIMRWTLGVHDPNRWLRDADHPEKERMLAHIDGPFKAALDRVKYSVRFDEASVSNARMVAQDTLRALGNMLRGRAFFGGDTLDFYDAAYFPFIRQFAGVDRDRFERETPAPLVTWWRAMAEAPEFLTVMAKVPVWANGDPPRRFRAQLTGTP